MIYYPQIVEYYSRHLGVLNPRSPTRAAITGLLAGNVRDATQALERMVADHVPDPCAYGTLGMIAYQYRQGGRAVNLLERVVELDPADANNLALLGACYLSMERFAEALATLRRALRRDPFLHVAHVLLWSALAGEGKVESVIEAMKSALIDEWGKAPAVAAPTPRLHLADVTLCMVDCANHALCARTLAMCMASCEFAQVKWLTDRPVEIPGIQVIVIPPIRSAIEYSRFLVKGLVGVIETRHVLMAQWDGYIVNPRAWSSQFVGYDYIGARWDHDLNRKQAHHNVGNGGFSLDRKSTRLNSSHIQKSRMPSSA